MIKQNGPDFVVPLQNQFIISIVFLALVGIMIVSKANQNWLAVRMELPQQLKIVWMQPEVCLHMAIVQKVMENGLVFRKQSIGHVLVYNKGLIYKIGSS